MVYVLTEAPARNEAERKAGGSKDNKTTFPYLESRRAEHFDDVVLPMLVYNQALEPELLSPTATNAESKWRSQHKSSA